MRVDLPERLRLFILREHSEIYFDLLAWLKGTLAPNPSSLGMPFTIVPLAPGFRAEVVFHKQGVSRRLAIFYLVDEPAQVVSILSIQPLE
jgi:hypothetical protein